MQKKKNMPLFFFVLFILIAVFTVALLEYIDFKKGKESFIFSKVIPLKTRPEKIKAFNTWFINLLDEDKILFEHFKDEKGRYHFKFNVSRKKFDSLISRVKKISGKLQGKLELSEIRRVDDKSLMLYSLKIEREASHILLITRVERSPAKKEEIKKTKDTPKPKKKVVRTPKVAFVIDDVGEYEIGALELKKLNIPITASILPESRRAHEEARWTAEYNLQALIHVPMQPKNSNGLKYNPRKTITLQSTDSEIRSMVKKAKEVVPNAAGVNNHMGSLVTSNRKVMKRFLKILKEEGLFFFDSKTIAGTVGYGMAKNLGIKTAIRDVFLDDGEKSYPNAVSEIKRLVDKALRNGKAIAIGHPHPTTLRAIKDSIKFIREKGVKIVFLSELLE
ncbi:MAG: divergent polysaccharide deacetylase family protein [Candidatus Aminicenantes bacterium]|nr:divergent polysaccharide deacetylase family protein [Candidatus Aminicenantes bacterium]